MSKARRIQKNVLTVGIKVTDVKQESSFHRLDGSGHSATGILRRATSDEDNVPISGLQREFRWLA